MRAPCRRNDHPARKKNRITKALPAAQVPTGRRLKFWEPQLQLTSTVARHSGLWAAKNPTPLNGVENLSACSVEISARGHRYRPRRSIMFREAGGRSQRKGCSPMGCHGMAGAADQRCRRGTSHVPPAGGPGREERVQRAFAPMWQDSRLRVGGTGAEGWPIRFTAESARRVVRGRWRGRGRRRR